MSSWWKPLLLSLILGLVSLPLSVRPAVAASRQPIHVQRGATPCWDEAGARHGVDPWLLYAIAYVESGYHHNIVSRPNRNGTRDLGLMQINSAWLPTLSHYGISRKLLFNACASTYIGAWIMAKNFRRYGYSWKAIAAYNVGSLNTPARYRQGYIYAQKVYAAYARLTGTPQP